MSATGPTPAGAPQVKSLTCPSCGATLTLRAFGHAVTIVCDSCHSILDAQDPRLQVLQKFEAKTGEDRPRIPLGTRGTIRGAQYEVIGFQRRTIRVEGIPYSWHEYLLFNPFKGFRYLTEYNGHWNDVSTLRALPLCGKKRHRETIQFRIKCRKSNINATSLHIYLLRTPAQICMRPCLLQI